MAPGPPYDSTRTKLADAWRHRAVSLKALSFGVIGIFNTAVEFRDETAPGSADRAGSQTIASF